MTDRGAVERRREGIRSCPQAEPLACAPRQVRLSTQIPHATEPTSVIRQRGAPSTTTRHLTLGARETKGGEMLAERGGVLEARGAYGLRGPAT